MDAGLTTAGSWTQDDVECYLASSGALVRTSLLYRAGLVLVALALILLQASYVALVALVGYGTWRYLLLTPIILAATGISPLAWLAAFAPLVGGIVATLFLLKPFLARPVRRPDSFQIHRSEQPVLFAFVDRLCDRLRSPRPSKIELDLQVNASARLGGWLSLFRSDLTLPIGIPLVTGLTLQQFAGALAHEFGHFSQHGGMRAYFLIERVRRWFTRVACERDKWDEWLDDMRGGRRNWQLTAIFTIAYGFVFLSRRILLGLLFCATVVSAWFSRQMEFNADRHDAELIGERTFAETLGRLSVLATEARGIWRILDHSFMGRRLCDDFAVVLRSLDEVLSVDTRTKLVEGALQANTDRWATHPSDHDRVDRVHGVQGVITGPDFARAEVIFTEIDELCRRVTRHFYEMKLGKPLSLISLVPAAEFVQETRRTEYRAQALRSFFFGLQQPTRYFRLALPGPAPGSIELRACVADQAADYWRVLEESLLRNSALEFMRSGGRINPASFRLSGSGFATVGAEVADSRRRLDAEVVRLRDLCSGQAYLLAKHESPFADAYRALSEEQDAFLELQHQFVAFKTLRANLKHLKLPAAANTSDERSRGLLETGRTILANLANCPSPLTPGHTMVDELLLFEPVDSIESEELAARLLNRFDIVAAELLGELCAIARRDTSAVGPIVTSQLRERGSPARPGP